MLRPSVPVMIVNDADDDTIERRNVGSAHVRDERGDVDIRPRNGGRPIFEGPHLRLEQVEQRHG